MFIIHDNPKELTFTVAADHEHVIDEPEYSIAGDENSRRPYITSQIKVRLHQRGFRERVLAASAVFGGIIKCLSGVSRRADWKSWFIYMLKAVEWTSRLTLRKVNDIIESREEILEVIREQTAIRRTEGAGRTMNSLPDRE